MGILFALTRNKTVLEMDSGWGIPVGVLMLFVVIIQLLRNSSGNQSGGFSRHGEYKGFADYTAADWRRHEELERARNAKRQTTRTTNVIATKARAEEVLAKARAEEAADSGNTLLQLLNETMERTGHTADQLCTLIRQETNIPVYVNSSNQLTATQEQLLMLIPYIEGLKELFQRLESTGPQAAN